MNTDIVISKNVSLISTKFKYQQLAWDVVALHGKSLASMSVSVSKQYFRLASQCHLEVASPDRWDWNEKALRSHPWLLNMFVNNWSIVNVAPGRDDNKV